MNYISGICSTIGALFRCVLPLMLLSGLHPEHAVATSPFALPIQLNYGEGNDRPALEIRFGIMPGDPPQLVGFSLYNQSPGNNIVAAHVIGPPYDGTGATLHDQIDSGQIFGLGPGCFWEADGGAVGFPYIKRTAGGAGQLRVATYTGGIWSTRAISGPPSNDFDSADCDNAGTKVFVSSHDRQQDRVSVFEGTSLSGNDLDFNFRFCVGGTDSCVAISDPQPDLMGPLDGALIPGLTITKVLASSPPMVEHNPGFLVAQDYSGNLNATVLAVNPKDASDVFVQDSCYDPELFVPDGNPAPNEMVVVRNASTYGADAVNGVILQNGVRFGAVRHSGTLPGSMVQRFVGGARYDFEKGCQINVRRFDDATSGALGFEGVTLLPYLTEGAGLMFDAFIEVGPDLETTAAYAEHPGNLADGGPRAACTLYYPIPPGARDYFVVAGAHPEGGLNFFRTQGQTLLRSNYETPISELEFTGEPITVTDTFAACF